MKTMKKQIIDIASLEAESILRVWLYIWNKLNLK